MTSYTRCNDGSYLVVNSNVLNYVKNNLAHIRIPPKFYCFESFELRRLEIEKKPMIINIDHEQYYIVVKNNNITAYNKKNFDEFCRSIKTIENKKSNILIICN